jgi:hypothetical protein
MGPVRAQHLGVVVWKGRSTYPQERESGKKRRRGPRTPAVRIRDPSGAAAGERMAAVCALLPGSDDDVCEHERRALENLRDPRLFTLDHDFPLGALPRSLLAGSRSP